MSHQKDAKYSENSFVGNRFGMSGQFLAQIMNRIAIRVLVCPALAVREISIPGINLSEPYLLAVGIPLGVGRSIFKEFKHAIKPDKGLKNQFMEV